MGQEGATKLARVAIAFVWLYNGLWCKVLAGCPTHTAIVAAVPGLGPDGGRLLAVGLGIIETALAAWVLSGWRPLQSAFVQTVLLVTMNAGGLVWGGARIADPAGMLVHNFAFLALVWLHACGAPPRLEGEARGETGWGAGRFDASGGPPVLLFGRMYEDWRIEAEAFAPNAAVFCIASAGCTAIALAARGHPVTAVDVNPAQVEYVRERLRGAPCREGAAERLLAHGRRFLPLVGWSAKRRRHFLSLAEPSEQARYWDTALETARFRALLRGLLAPPLLRLFFNPTLLGSLPLRFDDELRRRLRRAFSRYANLENPYAWTLLLGADRRPGSPLASRAPVVVECADAAEYLERGPAHRFGGFSLSNVLDGADATYARRLWTAVRRAATPDAVVVVRSFGLPGNAQEEEHAARDRSILWGRVGVHTLTGGPIG